MEKTMNNYMDIPAEKFALADRGDKITDKKFETKPVGYFKDAMIRFRKNKSSVVAAIIILILFLYAIIVPFISHFTINDRDGYYAKILPKSDLFAWAGWDGCNWQTKPQAGYDLYKGIGYEYGDPAVRKLRDRTVEESTGKAYYEIYLDSYAAVGFTYVDLSEEEYNALKAYQKQTKTQVCYPIANNYQITYLNNTNAANLWYKLEDDFVTPTGQSTSTGAAAQHDENGEPIFENNYKIVTSATYGKYNSLRLKDYPNGANGEYYCYAVKNQTGYKVRVLYSAYYEYLNGHAPKFLFGANNYGQDIFTCMAVGARLSFLLAISVSVLNFIIGVVYGSIEGYYGGAIDLILERISDVLSSVPFIVVATLFQMHLAQKVGPVISLLFAFVLTGWLGIAYRVRTQFYRFKNSEYVLAARTLGASDSRLIFRHILPNSLGTIITGTILIIPGVIFSESMLSYLGIVSLETSNLTSIGTMLSNGQSSLATYPHIILFPAAFISLLEISFNLFGNGLRDAFNPSLRGADE